MVKAMRKTVKPTSTVVAEILFFTAACMFVPESISQNPMQLGSPDLTQKCSIHIYNQSISPGKPHNKNWGSKGQRSRSRVKNSASVFFCTDVTHVSVGFFQLNYVWNVGIAAMRAPWHHIIPIPYDTIRQTTSTYEVTKYSHNLRFHHILFASPHSLRNISLVSSGSKWPTFTSPCSYIQVRDIRNNRECEASTDACVVTAVRRTQNAIQFTRHIAHRFSLATIYQPAVKFQ